MRQLEKEIVVLTLIHETIEVGGNIDILYRPSGIQITLKGLLAFLDLKGYALQAKTLHDGFIGYLGEEAYDLIIMDFAREVSGNYTDSYIQTLLRNSIGNVNENFISNFLLSFPHRRNELERAIRAKFIDNFVDLIGCTKTIARYIRIDISRMLYNVSWNTVRDKQGFTDAITKYKILTKTEFKMGQYPLAINIPELNLSLHPNFIVE